jgi:hypothetical protein
MSVYMASAEGLDDRPSVIDDLQIGCDRLSVSLDCGLLRWGDSCY